MARNLMPKSGIMMPYVVVSRDAAVVGVSTVDGKAGAIDLTTTYRKIADSYTKTETYTKTQVDNLISPIMTGALFKADPFVNNNIPFRSGGANGVTSINLIKANTDNSIHIGDAASGVQGIHFFSDGKLDVTYKNDGGVSTVAQIYSKHYRPDVADMPFASIGTYVTDSAGRTISVNRTGINSDIKQLTGLTTAITVAQGGTGATDDAGARQNIQAAKAQYAGLGTVNLNSIYGASQVGFYPQPASSNATTANHYPVNSAGALEVLFSGANGVNEAIQIYHPYNEDGYYKRRANGSGSGAPTWQPWIKFNTETASSNYTDTSIQSFGLSTTGILASTNANDLQRNGFFAGPGFGGVNYKNTYGPGIVLRRVNDTYQVQWSGEGRMSTRFANQGTNWTPWVDSLIVGDFGVGGTGSQQPTSTANCFMSDNNGSTTWAPSNGSGMQSQYDTTRIGQLWITPSNGLYVRWNQTGNAMVAKSTLAWVQLQAVGTSDINFKKVLGESDVNKSLSNISSMDFKEFYYLDDPDKTVRRGVIAQEVEKIDPEYVHSAEVTGKMSLDLNPLVLDALAAIKALNEKAEAQEARIAQLEAKIVELTPK